MFSFLFKLIQYYCIVIFFKILNISLVLRYDGQVFVENLKGSVEVRRRQNKEPLQIRYLHYVTWAIALRKKQVGPLKDGEEPKYSFPPAVLGFLRSLVPENIKGELWPTAYKVPLEEFAAGLDIPKKLFV